jgi:hypothetical protein
MAKKSKAVAILEGKLNLAKETEVRTRQSLLEVVSVRELLEDVLRSLRGAPAPVSGGGKAKRQAARKAMVEAYNKQAAADAKATAAADEAAADEAAAADARA